MKLNFSEHMKRIKWIDEVSRLQSERLPAGHVVNHGGVLRSVDYMIRNFQSPVQLTELVTESGMSRRGFIKAFNKQIGRTPGAVLRHMRIDYAKHLLETEDLPLKEIARRTGFRSENTFCVAFLRTVGVSPKKYQRTIWLAERRNQQKYSNPLLKLSTPHQSDHLHSFVRTKLLGTLHIISLARAAR